MIRSHVVATIIALCTLSGCFANVDSELRRSRITSVDVSACLEKAESAAGPVFSQREEDEANKICRVLPPDEVSFQVVAIALPPPAPIAPQSL